MLYQIPAYVYHDGEPIDKGTETDIFYSDPQVLNAIKEGIDQVKVGKSTCIRDLKMYGQISLRLLLFT
ncbi:hypothetical protein [Dyadobacter sandarakinus]|uniref:Uncharacterized protein n=1 Tax=Dyadobacter sandarakinus TaxID=2747268 RepID=A0ABX7I408_9BACT|nr:hypothetical protein [Dyadobacter sandarakinus]QRR00804.1 hypothetical protein HWI92_07725 [Dyadobacter sandarakinus]